MRFAIKPYNDLIYRADVKYNVYDSLDMEETSKLEDLKDIIVRDPMCYGFQYCSEGVPLIRISDLQQPFIDFSRIVFISEKEHKRYSKTHLQKYDILMSVRGVSIGKIGIFMGEYEHANISPNIIIIRLKNKELAPFVCMTLISDIGQQQIKRIIAGSSKPTITAPLINKIEIPRVDDKLLKRINQLFEEALNKRLYTNTLISKINNKFDYIFNNEKWDKQLINIKNIVNEGRWDPHYHNKKYEMLRKTLAKYPSDNIGDICCSVDETICKNNVSEQIGYIEISNVNNLTAQIENFKINYINNLPTGGKIPLLNEDILVSKVRPYRNANTIFKDTVDYPCVASKNAFTVFRTLDYAYPYYVLAFIRSYYGINQIVMYQSGTSYPTVSDDDIKLLRIPRLPEDIVKEINDSNKEYFDGKAFESNNISEVVKTLNNLL
ncbi:hypothetical protein [Fusobacterium varium]|uniref:hypothetical protein n=1 Tax=Fusobacterium varium TaxID=856 RepID=UPI00242C7422|nr:hypothetical protein [Fusobacterium varium]